MELPVDENGERLIEQLVRDGRYASATDVVEDGLRLLAKREAKLAALREHIQNAIAEGGSFTSDEIRANIEKALEGKSQN